MEILCVNFELKFILQGYIIMKYEYNFISFNSCILFEQFLLQYTINDIQDQQGYF